MVATQESKTDELASDRCRIAGNRTTTPRKRHKCTPGGHVSHTEIGDTHLASAVVIMLDPFSDFKQAARPKTKAEHCRTLPSTVNIDIHARMHSERIEIGAAKAPKRYYARVLCAIRNKCSLMPPLHRLGHRLTQKTFASKADHAISLVNFNPNWKVGD